MEDIGGGLTVRRDFTYYNAAWTHLGIEEDAPNGRPIQRRDVIVANAVLGGLHHHYARI
jgi:hypothetical protein